MKTLYMTLILAGALVVNPAFAQDAINREKIPDEVRAQQIKDMRFGIFICWSFSTFSGQEWTRDALPPSYFKVKGCDTDQWCKTAKEAGMNYILFLTKHHDGFCLWDTKTTELKVTNSPLGIDVLAKLKKSCDKYGLKLALYFSEADWSFYRGYVPEEVLPEGAPEREKTPFSAEKLAELKKAQLKELCTQYGPIEFFWMDVAQGDGGLSHKETTETVLKYQPSCFVGYNHPPRSGRIQLRERGKPGSVADKYNIPGEELHKYLVGEFTYPLLPRHKGGAQWFYSLPEHDNLAGDAERVYRDYLGAVKYGNIFSLNIGPDYEGKIRDVDVKTLQQIGKWIREGHTLPEAAERPAPKPIKISRIVVPSQMDNEKGGNTLSDGDLLTYWAADPEQKGPYEIYFHFDTPQKVRRVIIHQGHWNRISDIIMEVKEGDSWTNVYARRPPLGVQRRFNLSKTFTAKEFRLTIKRSTGGEPRLHEVEFF